MISILELLFHFIELWSNADVAPFGRLEAFRTSGLSLTQLQLYPRVSEALEALEAFQALGSLSDVGIGFV